MLYCQIYIRFLMLHCILEKYILSTYSYTLEYVNTINLELVKNEDKYLISELTYESEF